MDSLLQSAINRYRAKQSGAEDVPQGNLCQNEQNFVIPIMQRHWDTHCANPTSVVFTLFNIAGACQLLSNRHDQLLLNIALDQPQDQQNLLKFKKHRFYNLFKGDGNIYELEFGGMTDEAVQITSEILTDVFGVSVNQEINTIVEVYQP